MVKSWVPSDIKSYNNRIVFETVRRCGQIVRTDIARQTGMSAPTVLKVVQGFIDKGILLPSGEAETALGRKPLLLRFNPDALYTVGINFEGDHLSVALVNLAGDIHRVIRRRVPHTFDMGTADVIVKTISRLYTDYSCARERTVAIGIGIPGIVDMTGPTIAFAPLIGIHSPMDAQPVLAAIQTGAGLPVFVENDVNAAAIGETVVRKMGSDGDLLYVSLGTGLGAGIILGGALRRGRRSMAGEIGYTVYDPTLAVDQRGAGWLESQVNLQALKDRFGFDPDDGEAPQEMVQYVAATLAPAIVNLATQLDMDLVVLGGIVAEHLGCRLASALQSAADTLCINPLRIERPGSDEPGVLGAAALAAESVLDDILNTREGT